MGSLSAIFQAGSSLADYLRRARPTELGAVPCEFMTSGQMAGATVTDPTLVLLLYGVSLDEHSRNAARLTGPSAGTVPLGVNLHLLLTAWSADPQKEGLILGWAMRQLLMMPVLDRSLLLPADAWGPEDRIQITPVEPNIDQTLRIWEGLRQPYRMSMPYMARVVRIDVPPAQPEPPVVSRRFAYVPYDGGPVAPLVDEFNEQT
ncbi:MAG TPA: DUF4255 domain-containing protein [Roseiflexaceae bacterium]|nr:DUF4255 domain-containing protein [Roseiflexaceae bacterium]